MSLVDNIQSLVSRIGLEIKTVREEVDQKVKLSVSAVPATGEYDGKIIEFNGLFFKWLASPGAWVQVGFKP